MTNAEKIAEAQTALIVSFERFSLLLHKVEGFPDSERHETAVALSVVSGALVALGINPADVTDAIGTYK